MDGKPLTKTLFIVSSLILLCLSENFCQKQPHIYFIGYLLCWTISELDSKGRCNSLTSLSRLKQILMFLIAGNPLHSLTHTQTISPQALSKGTRTRFCLCRAAALEVHTCQLPGSGFQPCLQISSISCAPRKAFRGLKSTGTTVLLF